MKFEKIWHGSTTGKKARATPDIVKKRHFFKTNEICISAAARRQKKQKWKGGYSRYRRNTVFPKRTKLETPTRVEDGEKKGATPDSVKKHHCFKTDEI